MRRHPLAQLGDKQSLVDGFRIYSGTTRLLNVNCGSRKWQSVSSEMSRSAASLKPSLQRLPPSHEIHQAYNDPTCSIRKSDLKAPADCPDKWLGLPCDPTDFDTWLESTPALAKKLMKPAPVEVFEEGPLDPPPRKSK